jgi:hypothetical protein
MSDDATDGGVQSPPITVQVNLPDRQLTYAVPEISSQALRPKPADLCLCNCGSESGGGSGT